jgi:hypothetical protein
VLGGIAPSSSHKAAVTCAIEGFKAGQSIVAAPKAGKVGALQAAIQVGSSGSVCGRALDDVPKAEKLVGLAKEDVALFEGRSSGWKLGESVFDLAATILKLSHK